jgi:hypothetical protein
MVTYLYPPGADIVLGVRKYMKYMVCKQKVSYKSEMAGPLSRDDTIINKTFTFYLFAISSCQHHCRVIHMDGIVKKMVYENVQKLFFS